MDFNSILDRFQGSNFILYDGDESLLLQIAAKGIIEAWHTDKVTKGKSAISKRAPSDLLKPIGNAVYVIAGSGNAAGMRAENIAYQIIASNSNTIKIVIFYGYADFVITPSILIKQVFNGGCIVTTANSRITSLQHLLALFHPSTTISIPLRDEDFNPSTPLGSAIYDVMPYLHIWSRIERERNGPAYVDSDGLAKFPIIPTLQPKIPLVENMPTDILNIDNKAIQMDYDSTNVLSTVHWGQHKLLMAEIELFVEVIKRDINTGGNGKGFTVVYVGAAPGEGKESHIPFLSDLFLPYQISFHLWDRRTRLQDIKESTTIRIIPAEFEDKSITGDSEGFFTSVVVENYKAQYGENNRIIFISDIRDKATTEAIDNDMSMQMEWVEKLQPYASQLKFRIPDERISYEYLAGTIFTQAWARTKSLETRLLSYRPYSRIIYSGRDYIRSMNYFNNITRMNSYNMGKIVNTTRNAYSLKPPTGDITIGRHIVDIEDGLCTCHDCAREVQITTKYYALRGASINEKAIIAFIKRAIEKSRTSTYKKTLWDHSVPIISPAERRNIILFKQMPENEIQYKTDIDNSRAWYQDISGDIVLSNTSIDQLSIMNIGNILLYADDMNTNTVLGYLNDKEANKPLIVTDTPESLLKDILAGKHYPLVVNFHTDFISNYDIARDKGNVGRSKYELFVRDYKISQQRGIKRDLWSHLLFYTLSHMNK